MYLCFMLVLFVGFGSSGDVSVSVSVCVRMCPCHGEAIQVLFSPILFLFTPRRVYYVPT